MIQTDDDSTRARVLDLIAEKGPVSAAQLAKILSLTPAAVRRHITALEGSGEIVVRTPAGTGKRGRGRPARHYVATPEARTTFAEGYSDIAKRALGYLQQVAGDKAIDSFAAVRGRDLERRYMPVVEAAGKDPSDRARALADALTLDGYAATVREIANGTFAVQLCQGHCPVRDLAEDFQVFCEQETWIISDLLGVDVRRLSTMAGGAHVCTTHVPLNRVPETAEPETSAAPHPEATESTPDAATAASDPVKRSR